MNRVTKRLSAAAPTRDEWKMLGTMFALIAGSGFIVLFGVVLLGVYLNW